MNLINDPWIPIRRSDGTHELIAPWQLTETDNPVTELVAPRPDFNGALMQFLIGLLQTAATPKSHEKWLDWLEEPPTPEVLKAQFDQYASAFELQSEHGSFMQDFSKLNLDTLGIEQLLIDSPQENTVKKNVDHFVKHDRIQGVCEKCAATALFTLQINAPEGGPGHRTSIRGGGPLTTLIVLDENSDISNDLWRNLWLNILEKDYIETLPGNKDKQSLADIFPWLAKTRTSEKDTGCSTTPLDTNLLQTYWCMPRRLSIDWESSEEGACDLCGDWGMLITRYQSKNKGVNYTGAWQHPLSPYSVNKEGDLLAAHPQPGGFTYQHWIGFIEDSESRFSALVTKRYRPLIEEWGEQFRLYSFGYDTKSAKIRCWYETTFPLFTIPEDIRFNFAKRIHVLTDTASEFAGFVRSCVKEAWFKRSGDAKGDTSFLTQGFYQHTESAFFESARLLQIKLVDGTDKEVLHLWHKTLFKSALALFDYWAAQGDIAQANPRRVAEARAKLKKLAHSKKIKDALQLPIKDKQAKPKKEAA